MPTAFWRLLHNGKLALLGISAATNALNVGAKVLPEVGPASTKFAVCGSRVGVSVPAALAVFSVELKITPSPANCPASTLLVVGRVSVGVEVLAGAVIVNLPEAVELASAMEPVEVPGIPKTGAIVKAGPAAPVVLFPNTVPPAALLRENVRAGVDVAVATEVVNNGERPPALNEVTVPDVAGAAQTGFPEPLTVNTLPDEPAEPAESFRPAADDSRVNTPVIVPPASGRYAPAAVAT